MFKTLGKAALIGALAGRPAFTLAMAVVSTSTTLLAASILCTSYLGLSPVLVVTTAGLRAAARSAPEHTGARASTGAHGSYRSLDARSGERSAT